MKIPLNFGLATRGRHCDCRILIPLVSNCSDGKNADKTCFFQFDPHVSVFNNTPECIIRFSKSHSFAPSGKGDHVSCFLKFDR